MGYGQNISIKNWAEEDRPREKLILQGRRQLIDAELIAILVRVGTLRESAVELSRRILHACGNDLNQLARLSVKELSNFKGIGKAKAISIIAALELGRRRKDTERQKRVKISFSRDAYSHILPYFADLNHEEFWIMLLNRANYIMTIHQISKGGMSATVADPKVIFNLAIQHSAAGIILAHNHPSGSCKPSQQDIDLTRKLRLAGKIMDIPILDHIIVTDADYYSFADSEEVDS